MQIVFFDKSCDKKEKNLQVNWHPTLVFVMAWHVVLYNITNHHQILHPISCMHLISWYSMHKCTLSMACISNQHHTTTYTTLISITLPLLPHNPKKHLIVGFTPKVSGDIFIPFNRLLSWGLKSMLLTLYGNFGRFKSWL